MNEFEEAVRIAGNRFQLSKALGINVGTIYNWSKKKHSMSAASLQLIKEYIAETPYEEPLRMEKQWVEKAIKKAGSVKNLAYVLSFDKESIKNWITGKHEARPENVRAVLDYLAAE